MPAVESLLVYLTACVVITATPGPSNLYVASRSINQGHKAGIVSAIGLATGCLVHVVATAIGLSAIFTYSPLAYEGVKYIGAVYLIYLGIRTLLSKDTAHLPVTSQSRTLLRVYGQGILTELFNPKTALFFISFLPQFVVPSNGASGLQLLVLGMLFILIALPIDLLVAVSSGAVAKRMSRQPAIQRIQRWFSGSLLLGLGIHVAVSDRN